MKELKYDELVRHCKKKGRIMDLSLYLMQEKRPSKEHSLYTLFFLALPLLGFILYHYFSGLLKIILFFLFITYYALWERALLNNEARKGFMVISSSKKRMKKLKERYELK